MSYTYSTTHSLGTDGKKLCGSTTGENVKHGFVPNWTESAKQLGVTRVRDGDHYSATLSHRLKATDTPTPFIFTTAEIPQTTD